MHVVINLQYLQPLRRRILPARKPLDELIGEVGPAELRRRTGLDPRTIRKVRKGETVPYRDTAERMARGLGTDLEGVGWPQGFLPIDHPSTIRGRAEANARREGCRCG